MKWKPQRGVDLICRKHGATAVIVGECGPSDARQFEVTCKGNGRRTSCRHHQYASKPQVEGILKAHPDCALREYRPNAWEALFED